MGSMLGGGGKSSGSSTSTQKTEPWEGQKPFLTTGFERAQSDILNDPTMPYPNSTVVPFAPQTEAALEATQNRAMMGSPLQAAGNRAMFDTAAGNYLMADNPYFQNAMNAANEATVRNFQTAVQPGIDSMFSGAGRYGSGQHFGGMSSAYKDLAGQIANTNTMAAYRNYGDERARQMGAAQGAPGYAMADYNDMDKLMKVGQAYEGQAGANLQDEIQRYYETENANKDAIAKYMALVAGGNYGGSATTTQPIYASGGGLSSLLGLGMLGYGMMK